jgi:ACR3 family arsenite efflux pump ArsB
MKNMTFIENLVKESIIMLCSVLLLLLLCFNIMISICIKYYLKESYSFIKLSFTSRSNTTKEFSIAFYVK